MNARDAILQKIRTRMGGIKDPAVLSKAGRQELIPPGLVRGSADLVDLFETQVQKLGASFKRLDGYADIPGAVAQYMEASGLSATPAAAVFLPDAATFEGLDWAGQGIETQVGLPPPREPATVLGGCYAAIAETGSIALSSRGPAGPESNLLAQHHIVVVEAAQIVGSIESVWRRIAAATQPRSLMFVSGPSRTGDIEMTLELGAHGAVGMHILVLTGGSVPKNG